MAILDTVQVRGLYDRIARRYDTMLLGFRLAGLDRERRSLVTMLGLTRGDTVVDLCCGTGENLRWLEEAVGPGGRVVAFDLSDEMLAVARGKAIEAGWVNVSFVAGDVIDAVLPDDMHGAISTFGLEMVPGHDTVIERIARTLPSGGRLALLGLKQPTSWPRWLRSFGIWLTKSFGTSGDYDFRPWEAARRHMTMIDHKPLLFGAAYRCVAQVP